MRPYLLSLRSSSTRTAHASATRFLLLYSTRRLHVLLRYDVLLWRHMLPGSCRWSARSNCRMHPREGMRIFPNESMVRVPNVYRRCTPTSMIYNRRAEMVYPASVVISDVIDAQTFRNIPRIEHDAGIRGEFERRTFADIVHFVNCHRLDDSWSRLYIGRLNYPRLYIHRLSDNNRLNREQAVRTYCRDASAQSSCNCYSKQTCV